MFILLLIILIIIAVICLLSEAYISGAVLLVLSFACIPMIFVPIMPDYSVGERTGDIYKVSEKGVFYKSIEGRMYLGGASNNKNGIELDEFTFSIPEKQFKEKSEIIDRLKKCSSTRKLCTVKYSQYLNSPISIETSYVVVDVIESSE